jgi:hypothetical protein
MWKSSPMMWREGMKFERYDHSWPSNILEEKIMSMGY